jgi:hypothetical protein
MLTSISNIESYVFMRFHVLMAATIMFRVFWDILLCSQIDVDIDFEYRIVRLYEISCSHGGEH